MHRALQAGDRVEVVHALLLVDKDITNLQDEAGQTALHVACRLGRRKAAKLLLVRPHSNRFFVVVKLDFIWHFLYESSYKSPSMLFYWVPVFGSTVNSRV